MVLIAHGESLRRAELPWSNEKFKQNERLGAARRERPRRSSPWAYQVAHAGVRMHSHSADRAIALPIPRNRGVDAEERHVYRARQ